MRTRREVLGDAWVDRAVAGTTPFTADFQDFITRTAWGDLWQRPGLARRDRSLMTLSITIALRHWEEFALHVRAAKNNGLTDEEIAEVLPARGDLRRRAGRQPRVQGGRADPRGAARRLGLSGVPRARKALPWDSAQPLARRQRSSWSYSTSNAGCRGSRNA